MFDGADPNADRGFFATFSIPFWLVGFGLVGLVVWNVWGHKSARFDGNSLLTYQRCLFWSRSKSIPLGDVQCARRHFPQVMSGGSPTNDFNVEVVYRDGSFILETDSPEERRWLTAEINNFLQSRTA